jgi:hypothetical protein
MKKANFHYFMVKINTFVGWVVAFCWAGRCRSVLLNPKCRVVVGSTTEQGQDAGRCRSVLLNPKWTLKMSKSVSWGEILIHGMGKYHFSSLRAFQWMVMSVCFDNLKCFGQLPVSLGDRSHHQSLVYDKTWFERPQIISFYPISIPRLLNCAPVLKPFCPLSLF